MSVDPRFERSVLAELALEERRARRPSGSLGARALAEMLHRGRHDLLAHLRRVAYAVPGPFRAVAWLHHAGEVDTQRRTLFAAGLSPDEVEAVELLGQAKRGPERPLLSRMRTLSNAPGMAGYLARVVARAAIEDRLDGPRPTGESLTALRLLPDPRLTRSIL